MPGWNPKANEIFLAVLESPTVDQRLALLEQACAGDAALRVEVEALVRAHEAAGSFLAAPALAAGARSPVARPGTVIGRYTLLKQIGEGGMGVVYLAEQSEPVHRQVALKIIKPGMDSREVIARFEAERQALALMDWPHIARVFDAGETPEGLPYFVMEPVQGVPITDYCDQNRLSVAERLELFVTVCQAVQHAHQKGIIHRDIKPSNVLVTLLEGRPVPKVIDFGVAKAIGQRLTDKTLHTRFAQVVGTPLYMSPEQAEITDIDVDTRGDIYSLGVLLYELLTGTTPFERARLGKAAWDEIRRVIRDEDPPAPSLRLSGTAGESQTEIAAQRRLAPRDLSRLLRGDLDWVVMKALEKDRTRRYETASSFAADVVRYLSHEPVQARPPSAAYRFRKFARRNRAAIATSALLTAALVAGTVISAWQASRAIEAERLAQARLQAETAARNDAEMARHAEAAQRQVADQRRAEADQLRIQAEANFHLARRAVDDMYTQVAEKWLANQPQMEQVQREFLQKALEFYAESASQTSTDPAIRLETARAFRRVSEIHSRLGETARAEEAAQQAIERLQMLVDEFPEKPAHRRELADCLHKLGVLLGDIGRGVEEEAAHRRALSLQERLVADFPDVPEYRRDLARGYWYLGNVLLLYWRFVEEEEAYLAALPLQKRLVSEYPSVPEYRDHLADTFAALAFCRQSLGGARAGTEGYRDAAALLEDLIREFPNVPSYRNKLAVIHYRRAAGLPDREAEQPLREALALQAKLAADFPGVVDHRYDLLRSLESLGLMTSSAGRIGESEDAFREAIEIGEKLVADCPTVNYYRNRLATTYTGFAEMLRANGRLTEAEAAYRKAITLKEALDVEVPGVPRAGPHLNALLRRLRTLLVAAGQIDEADEIRRRMQPKSRAKLQPVPAQATASGPN